MTVTDRTYGTQLVEKHNDWDFNTFTTSLRILMVSTVLFIVIQSFASNPMSNL